MFRHRFIIALCAALLASACGFSLQGRGDFLDPAIQSIAVPPFQNLTGRPELEQRITEEILRQFQIRSRRRTTASPANADAVLQGEVTTYRETPVEFNPDGRARTIEVQVTARARLVTTRDQEVVWASDHFMFRQAYPVGQEAAEFVELEVVAIDVVARDFGQAVVTSILEGF